MPKQAVCKVISAFSDGLKGISMKQDFILKSVTKWQTVCNISLSRRRTIFRRPDNYET
ncbi:hypothetical protein NEIELOOT_00714 [Neisseria elongata subsp. glycolytica ATCC 29315]|uniref:Uncharacterized protein n=1 Tax=Neisseria elongata subsp. glycolytica ATCC 29315 TaxID=546263 RepID=D4DNT0_NEIEG|nr:hypothetical protein NEIELOOT_00714 [Neisseria elongata subsp. glycolytica ATCC 29315]